MKYVSPLLFSVAVFLFIRSRTPIPGPAADVLWHLLLAMTAVVAAGRFLGRVFARIGQPPVIGEVVGGILLGPSLLGLVWPAAYAYLLPPSVVPALGAVAEFGVIAYMFLVGVELDLAQLRQRIYSIVTISTASIAAPFVMGAALAPFLYTELAARGVPFSSFALFLGLAMSITAFPVLARILADSGLIRTDLGTIALTCASINDVTAWCLLAVVAGFAQAGAGSALMVAALSAAFAAFMFVVVRPFVVKQAKVQVRLAAIGLALAGMLLAALATEAIGIHALFGAFLFGALIPHESDLAVRLKQRLETIVTVVLLPAFFAFTGLRTEIGLVSGTGDWILCGLIIAVATAGKFGGTFLAARWTGLQWRHAAGLGVLMNTRGLMELIVLNVGLELGVISPKLFTMMVIMALVTTIATTPLLRFLTREVAV